MNKEQLVLSLAVVAAVTIVAIVALENGRQISLSSPLLKLNVV